MSVKLIIFSLLFSPSAAFTESKEVDIGIYDIPGRADKWLVVVNIHPYVCNTEVLIKDLTYDMDKTIERIVTQCHQNSK
jgi:hypothetical protein